MRVLLPILFLLSFIVIGYAQTESQTTITDTAIATTTLPQCGWCGTQCARIFSDLACIALAPPPNTKCFERNGQCVTECINPPSCPAPPQGCKYVDGNCGSCGNLVCETTTTTTLQGYCDWCGGKCTLILPNMGACNPEIKPPPNTLCVKENDQCVAKPVTTTTLITGTEEYCHKFTYTNCPVECEVGPSCPMCSDIGCHAKGAHKPTTTTTTSVCKDSDSGKNYYVKGRTTGICKYCDQQFQYKDVWDVCARDSYPNTESSPSKLFEYSCNNEGYFDSETYFCPNECRDGACISLTTTTTQRCPNVQCIWDPCPGNHIPDANGCVNCASPCKQCKSDEECPSPQCMPCPPDTPIGSCPSCPVYKCIDGQCRKLPSTPVCGNRICEEGEVDYCPPCTTATPPCMVPCYAGKCPQDCPTTSTTIIKKCDANICRPYICCETANCPLGFPEMCSGCTKDICSSTSYRNAYWQCYDGHQEEQGGSTSCKPSETWKKYAEESCVNKCSKETGKCGVNTFKVWNECGPQTCPVIPLLPDCKNGRIKTIYDDKGCPVGRECEQIPIGKCPEYVMCPDGTKNPCFESEDTCTCKQCEHQCKKICRDIGMEKEGWYDSCTGNLIKFDRCGGDTRPPGTRPSDECRYEVDETGFTRVICERKCPELPPHYKEKCINYGGDPVIRKDYSGCEYIDCLFEGGGMKTSSGDPIFKIFRKEFHECPTEEEAEMMLKKCEEFGGKVFFEYKHECKIPKCVHEEERRGCSEITPPTEAIGKECERQGLKVIKDFDPQTGCPVLRCGDKEACNSDVPQKVYDECKEKGGELVVKKNDQGCVAFYDCITRGDERNIYVGEINKVPDSSELLSLALKLEGLRIELDKLSRETGAIADYYASVKSPEEEKYKRVSLMFETAKEKVDEIKSKIRASADKMTIDDLTAIKRDVKYIKEVMLKDILYLMLSSGDDAKEIAEGKLDDCKNDNICFERAFRICKRVSFDPEGDGGPHVTIVDLEDNKCILKVEMKVDQVPDGSANMTCKFENYALGLGGKEDFLSLCEGPLVKFMKIKYGSQSSGASANPSNAAG